jgi:glycosyltransferase involved in cell wall biosynthesis
MRILHCLSQIPGKTGSGIYLQAIVREAAVKRGIEQAVVCGIPQSMAIADTSLAVDSNKIFATRFETDKLPFPVAGMSDVMPYPSTRFSTFNQKQLKLYKAAFSKTLLTAVKAFSPDLIHTHHLWLLTALCRKLFPDIPVVTSVHGTELRQLELAPQLADEIVQGVAQVNKVMLLNPTQRRLVADEYGLAPEQMVVTGTGYRQDLFCRSYCAKESCPTIIYAGKLSRAKGVLWLVKAFNNLDTEAVLWLAGSGAGPEADEVHALAAQNPRIKLLGALSQSELAAYFQRAHIMALPSFYEGLPLVILEALACDCRVVVTDLPGIRDLIGAEAITEGLVSCIEKPPLHGPDILETKDEKPFIENLERALLSQLKQVSKQQFICGHKLQTILSDTGWQHVFKRIEMVYKEILSRD